MKKISFVLIIFLPGFIMAQQYAPVIKPTDSTKYYRQEFAKLWRDNYDSLSKTEKYKFLVERIKQHRKAKNGYTGTVLFGELAHSDYGSINASIVQNGFTPLNAMSFRAGFGISNKTDPGMFDFYFLTGGFNNASSKNDESIKASFSNALELNWGYDLLKSKIVSLYPYGGFSLRFSSLTYSKSATLNSSFTNISNIVTNDPSVDGESFRIGYQLGMGLDFLISGPNNKKDGIILFTKFGTNRSIRADSYLIDGIDYKPGIKHGDWLVSFGIKYVTRH
jgi:hypothetical protein